MSSRYVAPPSNWDSLTLDQKRAWLAAHGQGTAQTIGGQSPIGQFTSSTIWPVALRIIKVVVGAGVIVLALALAFLPEVGEAATTSLGFPELAPVVGGVLRGKPKRGVREAVTGQTQRRAQARLAAAQKAGREKGVLETLAEQRATRNARDRARRERVRQAAQTAQTAQTTQPPAPPPTTAAGQATRRAQTEMATLTAPPSWLGQPPRQAPRQASITPTPINVGPSAGPGVPTPLTEDLAGRPLPATGGPEGPSEMGFRVSQIMATPPATDLTPTETHQLEQARGSIQRASAQQSPQSPQTPPRPVTGEPPRGAIVPAEVERVARVWEADAARAEGLARTLRTSMTGEESPAERTRVTRSIRSAEQAARDYRRQAALLRLIARNQRQRGGTP